MIANQITNETPIAFLTVGQLLELLNSRKENQVEPIQEKSKLLVYGLRGIRNLFGVSHATAYKYKSTIISEAVMQNGRKLIVDVDKALELFKMKSS